MLRNYSDSCALSFHVVGSFVFFSPAIHLSPSLMRKSHHHLQVVYIAPRSVLNQRNQCQKKILLDLWGTGVAPAYTFFPSRVIYFRAGLDAWPPSFPSHTSHRLSALVKENHEVRHCMLCAGGWGQRIHRSSACRVMGEARHPN